MRATLALSAAFAATASARLCGPRASSVTFAVTSTTISSTPLSTDIPASTETPTSTIIVDTSTSSADTSTSSADSSTSSPETSTSSLGTVTSSAAPAPPAPTVLGFCLKAATPSVYNYGQRVAVPTMTSPLTANLIMAAFDHPSYPSTAYFNLDFSTGAVTLNNTDYAGYQVYLLPPFNNQVLRVMRVTKDPATPLLCFNPDGQYTSGSILKCSGTGQANDGPRTYNGFACSGVASTASSWQVRLAGYQSTSTVIYDVAMFFGNDCL